VPSEGPPRAERAHAHHFRDRECKERVELVSLRHVAERRSSPPLRGLKLVTYHKNFDYLARRFGLEIVGMLEPKPGIPPSPAHVAQLVPTMQSAKVTLVLVEPNRERQVPDFVAEKAGAHVVVLPIMPGTPEAPEYLDLIDYDLRQIVAAAAKR
jgi:ABC-type Zn uptake system ZnuABC Zn-binding protein ZnuA